MVSEAVSQQLQLRTSLLVVPADALPFFNDFGPDLCREWHLLRGQAEESLDGANGTYQQSSEMATATTLGDLRRPGVDTGLGESSLDISEPLQAPSLPGFDPDGDQFPDEHSAAPWSGWDPFGSWLLTDWGNEGPW